MRRLRILCVVAVLTALPTVLPMQAQMARFAIKGGFEMTEMDFTSESLNKSNRTGFYIGPQVKFKLPVIGLGIDVSALYNYRDLKVEEESFNQQSLLIPANVRYGVGLGEALGIFLCAGPQFSFNLGDDVMYWRDNEKNNNQFNLQNTMLSLNLGLGVNFGPHLEAALFYNVPLGKTADFTWDLLGEQLEDQTWKRAKSRTNAWHLSLSYYF